LPEIAMHVIRKNGFYLWSFNPYVSLWIESKDAAKIMTLASAYQHADWVGGEVIAA